MTQNVLKYVIAVSLFSDCALATVPLFGQSPPSGGVTQPVQVVNTPNVNVANTPSVSVTNTPNVTVTNTPSVNVANTPTVALEAGAGVNVTSPLDGEGNPSPIAVLDAIQPYEDYCQILFAGSDSGSCSFQAVPSGKRLVIQEFDATGAMETGLQVQFIDLEPSSVYHYFPATHMASSGGVDYFATHQETRLYSSSGSAPNCSVGITTDSSIGSYLCQLSGFLVDDPTGGSNDGAPVRPHRVPALPNGRSALPGRQQNNAGR